MFRLPLRSSFLSGWCRILHRESAQQPAIDPPPRACVDPTHRDASGKVASPDAIFRLGRVFPREVAELLILARADRHAPRATRNAERRQRVRQIIRIAALQRTKPVVE